jgi:hypothetical protein
MLLSIISPAAAFVMRFLSWLEVSGYKFNECNKYCVPFTIPKETLILSVISAGAPGTKKA